MLSHKQLVKKMLANPAVKARYDEQKEEFALFDELVKARAKAGLTQADVAQRMGTQVPAISRLEAGARTAGHSPSIATLQRYADAVGCRLVVKLAPKKKSMPTPRSLSLKRAA